MSPRDYKRQREALGSQESVARALGVHRVTIAKRETGKQVITREAWLALLSLTRADVDGA
jgi:DNA-binding XRE family transcriptional regulator